MEDYQDIVRGEMGFTYDPQVDNGVSIIDIRDPQDDYFAHIRYFQDTQEYAVEIDAGYSVREDLEHVKLLDGVQLHRTNVTSADNIFEQAKDKATDWRSMTHGTQKIGEHVMKIKNIDSEEIKTHVTLLSPDKKIACPAETIINAVNPPAVETQQGDHYDETWAPWSNSAVIRNKSGNRQQTVQQVFETAIDLSEDILEPRQET